MKVYNSLEEIDNDFDVYTNATCLIPSRFWEYKLVLKTNTEPVYGTGYSVFKANYKPSCLVGKTVTQFTLEEILKEANESTLRT